MKPPAPIIDMLPLVAEDGQVAFVQATPELVTPPAVQEPYVTGESIRAGGFAFHSDAFVMTSPPLTEGVLDLALTAVDAMLYRWMQADPFAEEETRKARWRAREERRARLHAARAIEERK